MRIIAFQNLKGGTGKTTSVISISAYLAFNKGQRVLILDCDPQGNIKESFGLRKPEYTMYDLIISDMLLEDCIVNARKGETGGVIDCIISDNTLAACEMQLVSMPRREEVLKLRMRNVDAYDFVLIDCSPSLSILNQNALLYAQDLVIPISMDYLAMLGATQIIDNLHMIQKYFEKTVQIAGIIPTFFNGRTNMSKEVLKALQDTYGDNVLPAVRIDTKIQQASSARTTIFEYANTSRGAEDYALVAEKLMGNQIPEQELLTLNTEASDRDDMNDAA
ncbi:MAG: ParA family protein [bacterium]